MKFRGSIQRIVFLFTVPILLFGLAAPTHAASAARVGGSCTKVGISTLSQGQVLICSSKKVWSLKAAITIGTSTRIQSILNDKCDVVGAYGIFSTVAYVCAKTSRGKVWQVSSRFKTSTQYIPQEIEEKPCSDIGLVTIINGKSYTCTYTRAAAIWRSTTLATIATALRSRPVAGIKCRAIGDITIIRGKYYSCTKSGSINKWVLVSSQDLPKIIQSSVVAQAARDLAEQIAYDNRKRG